MQGEPKVFDAATVCLAIESLREMFSVGSEEDNADRDDWAAELDAADLPEVAAAYRAWATEQRIRELERVSRPQPSEDANG